MTSVSVCNLAFDPVRPAWAKYGEPCHGAFNRASLGLRVWGLMSYIVLEQVIKEDDDFLLFNFNGHCELRDEKPALLFNDCQLPQESGPGKESSMMLLEDATWTVGYIGIMEKKMETTCRVYTPKMENQMKKNMEMKCKWENYGLYWGLYRGYTGIMKTRTETTT